MIMESLEQPVETKKPSKKRILFEVSIVIFMAIYSLGVVALWIWAGLVFFRSIRTGDISCFYLPIITTIIWIAFYWLATRVSNQSR